MLTQQAVLSRGDRALLRIWFFDKKISKFFSGQGQDQIQTQPGFQAQPCFQQVQDHVIHGYSLFGLKTTSQGKSDIKYEFLRSDFPCEVVFRPKNWITTDNMNLNLTLLKPNWAWKPCWTCYLALTLTRKNFKFFFFKNQIRYYARSPRERTACCVNICPKKEGCYFLH